MSPEERIATLVLHGCRFMRKDPVASGYNAAWRGITTPEGLALVIGGSAYPLPPVQPWLRAQLSAGSMASSVECPWDAGLIATIPETMFTQYLELLVC
jgi:hypothetical protein